MVYLCSPSVGNEEMQTPLFVDPVTMEFTKQFAIHPWETASEWGAMTMLLIDLMCSGQHQYMRDTLFITSLQSEPTCPLHLAGHKFLSVETHLQVVILLLNSRIFVDPATFFQR